MDIILGVDPGSHRIGYGVISSDKSNFNLLETGVIDLKKGAKSEVTLQIIKTEIKKIIEKHHPTVLAVEKLYITKNHKTVLGVAESRGIIILTALEAGLEIQELNPNEIKAGIAGYGSADKKSVAKMVGFFLKKPNLKIIDDATDALASAIVASNKKSTGPWGFDKERK
jgi:crossover junction endodeoxyribonuclease RuvC